MEIQKTEDQFWAISHYRNPHGAEPAIVQHTRHQCDLGGREGPWENGADVDSQDWRH